MSSARRVNVIKSVSRTLTKPDYIDYSKGGTHALLPWSEYEAMEAVCEAMRKIRDFDHEHFELSSDFQERTNECAECQRWRKMKHPVQGDLCDKHWREINNRDRDEASARNSQHYGMRSIAREALDALEKARSHDDR